MDRLTDFLDMTMVVDWEVKPHSNNQKLWEEFKVTVQCTAAITICCKLF